MLTIGEIIRINREQQRISQEELSYGICAVSNLSRIENGMQIPGRATYEALMERLGVDPEIFPSFLNEREVESFRLKHKIVKLIFNGKYEQAELLLEKLDSGQKLEKVYEQYIQYARILILGQKGGKPDDILDKMKTIAKMSIRDYSPGKIVYQAFNLDDLSILNSLAIAFYNAGEEDEGIELLYALKEYIERKVVNDDVISPMYTMVLYNLSKWVGLKDRHNEVLRLCKIGIPRCIDYGANLCFAGLLLNKGYALVMLGKKDEGQKYLQEAYYINRARGESASCEIVKNFVDEHGLQI